MGRAVRPKLWIIAGTRDADCIRVPEEISRNRDFHTPDRHGKIQPENVLCCRHQCGGRANFGWVRKKDQYKVQSLAIPSSPGRHRHRSALSKSRTFGSGLLVAMMPKVLAKEPSAFRCGFPMLLQHKGNPLFFRCWVRSVLLK